MSSYDSRPDTLAHIRRVQDLISDVHANLNYRAIIHDESKLESPEVEAFDAETPKLKELTYGSDQYKAALGRLGEALDHHYAVNPHHPEYWAYDVDAGVVNQEQLSSGEAISRMSLVSLIEMLVDWKAASERHDDGDIRRSIEVNADRFGYGDQLKSVFIHTAMELGWIEEEEEA